MASSGRRSLRHNNIASLLLLLPIRVRYPSHDFLSYIVGNHFAHLTYDPSAERELVPEYIFGLFGSNCLSKSPIREVVHSSRVNFLTYCHALQQHLRQLDQLCQRLQGA